MWLFFLALLIQIPTPRVEGGVIAGTVRQADGKPAVGVRVAAMPADSANPAVDVGTLVSLTQTDEAGRYRLEDVPPGRYYVVAGRVDAPTFYPGTPDVVAGTIVVVNAGGIIEGIDFNVTAESLKIPRNRAMDLNSLLGQLGYSLGVAIGPPVQIPGRILLEESSKGAPLPQSLRLVGRMRVIREGASPPSSAITPAGDGSFTVGLVPGEGSLSLVGLPEGYSVKSFTSGSQDLLSQTAMIRQGMPEIVIVLSADLRPRFRVSGRVLDGATQRPLLGEHIELVSASGSNVRIIIDAQGRFEFLRVLAGDYILRINSSRFGPLEQRIAVAGHITELELRTTSR